MKNNRKMSVAISVSFAALLFACWSIIGFTQAKSENSDLSFLGKSNKESYILGEPVTVQFTLFNKSNVPIKVSARGVETGGLRIYISRGEGADYKEYFDSSWGRRRGYEIALEPDQSQPLGPATVLWNGRPYVAHLSEDAARQALVGKITTDYAFPEAGVYLIKGVTYFGEKSTPIESEPIKVIITEPLGEDLEIWKRIKGNGQIAVLMQRGEFFTSDERKKQDLIERVEQLLTEHPNSTYSIYLRTNLEKYKADELRRKLSFERSTIKPND